MTDMSSGPALDLDAIVARAEAATPGPWKAMCYVMRDGTLRRVEYDAGGLNEGAGFTVADMDAREGGDAQNASNAAFIAHARTDVPALVKALREAWAERDAAMAETNDGWQVTHALAGRVKMMREAADHWKAMLQERARERDAARAEAAQWKERAEAAEARDIGNLIAERNAACAEAERAEAGAGQMRAALEKARLMIDGDSNLYQVDDVLEVALATSVGKGWVSPAEAEALRARITELEAGR